MEQRAAGSASGDPTHVSLLLKDIHAGNSNAETLLLNIVYSELKRLASRCFRGERADHTLQTTAVVHEAYLRLAGGAIENINDRRHFFAMAARQMRLVLVDHARARAARKRGSGSIKVELDEGHGIVLPRAIDVMAIDRALDGLQKEDHRAAQVVELKYFGGYTDEEIAVLLEVALITVRRDWVFARAWLERALEKGVPKASGTGS